MGSYVEARDWLVGTTGGYGVRAYRAYRPHKIAGWDPVLGNDAVNAVAMAGDSIRGIATMPKTDVGGALADWMMARDESIRSSLIEGVESTGDALAWARYRELSGQPASDENDALTLGASRQVVAAVDLGKQMRDGHVCTADDILRVHATLFENTQQSDMGGMLRSEPIWVGPKGCRIDEASFVAPPPGDVPELLDDLAAYLNTARHLAVTQAAVAHAQFETIHPFEDGNGRTGRALIHTVFNARGVTSGTVPISAALNSDRQRYYQALNATHVICEADDNASRSKGMEQWIQCFGDACVNAHAQAVRTVSAVEDLAAEWGHKARFRSGSAAAKLLDALPSMPIMDSEMVAARLNVSDQVARLALRSLADAGIIRPTGGSRNIRYEVPEMIEMLREMNPDGAMQRADRVGAAFHPPVVDRVVLPVRTPAFIACGHRGPRSRRPCILQRGHAGQHRYT